MKAALLALALALLGVVPVALAPLLVPLALALSARGEGAEEAAAPTPVRFPGVCEGKLERALAALTKLASVLPELGGLMALIGV